MAQIGQTQHTVQFTPTVSTETPRPFLVAQSIASSASLEALLARLNGPITPEGLMVVLTDMLQIQNGNLREKIDEFKEQTALQKKYAEYRELMQAAEQQAKSTGKHEDKYLQPSDLLKIGFSEEEVARITGDKAGANGGTLVDNQDDKKTAVSARELADFLNHKIFGDDAQYYVDIRADNFEMSTSDFSSSVLDQIDSAREANTVDTQLLMADIQNISSEIKTVTSLISNLMKTLHDTYMTPINNLR